MTEEPKTEFTEIVSPEGVEERLIEEHCFRITMTLGGRFRVYHRQPGKDWQPTNVHETKEKARQDLGFGMMIMGGFLKDAKGTIDVLLEMLKGGKKKP